MKPQNGLKRESSTALNDDTKRKCLPKNGVPHDLEKYISYLSQNLSPKVFLDVGKQTEEVPRKISTPIVNGSTNPADVSKTTPNTNSTVDFYRSKCSKEKAHTTMNGFVDIRNGNDSFIKEKPFNGSLSNGTIGSKKQRTELKSTDPFANGVTNVNKSCTDISKRKVPIPASDLNGVRIAPATSASQTTKKTAVAKPDTTRMNCVVSSTTKLDSRMNGVTCGSNNLSLNITCKPTNNKKEPHRKIASQQTKRTNRKSSACIANSKNLTWSKANNLKQVQLQKQSCVNAAQSPVKQASLHGEASAAPKMNIPNGVRQVPLTMNGNLGNMSVPVSSFQNCHQINIPQQCNGTVTSTNLASFVALNAAQNVMLTALRIPQNGMTAQTINQQNNMNAFNRPNVNVSSPTKLNGQFVFPLVQNINGAVVQIPNLMAKMHNFVLPQNTQRPDHLQNQQAAQILINGTLLKLANTMTSTYQNVNKPATSQPVPVMNKSVPTMPTVGMTVQPKQNYTVNFSHPVLVPQPGFIVTSVPNMNVKETWSYTGTNTLSTVQTSCSNPIVHHPSPMVASYTTQSLHTSSFPIAAVKPPDNPIQGTDPPSSTVQEPEMREVSSPKCDVPWLSKTVNNNIVPLDSKMASRPFAQLSCLSSKYDELTEKVQDKVSLENEEARNDNIDNELRKVEDVARREETIFTQITVLKDVSSNVHSSVMEANFCSATMESSESGIGTDKSIDSPSDSQTSKECDEDSSLSLSVSVCSADTQSCQKSPILKQPKTLRFPPRNPVKPNSDKRKSSTDTTSTVTLCLWENCKSELDSDSDLLEHLQVR